MSIPRQRRSSRATGLLAGALLAAVLSAPTTAQVADARVRPPTALACPRDHLTVYIGRVLRYRRGAGRTTIGLRTDEATSETVVIRHPGNRDPSPWFLIERQPFHAADWARIEQRPGTLRAGMRAAAWVCDDGRNPVVDWQPPPGRTPGSTPGSTPGR